VSKGNEILDRGKNILCAVLMEQGIEAEVEIAENGSLLVLVSEYLATDAEAAIADAMRRGGVKAVVKATPLKPVD